MPARKLEAPTPEYLISLKSKEQVALEALAYWKKKLYVLVGEAKLGEYEFEEARKNCLEQTQVIKKVGVEIARVEKALENAG